MNAMNRKGKLLVTGAAGFVGSRFVESCNNLKIPVISVDKSAYFKSRHIHDDIDFGRIVDRETFFKEFTATTLQEEEVTAIVHMGACTDTTEFDVEYLKRINLEYTKSLWNLATKAKIPFIYASSAATYGNGDEGYDDNEASMHKLKPLNPYGQSKQDFDIWALAEEKKGNHPPAWSGFKFFNVYGYGEDHKGKMASVILHAFTQINKTGLVKLFKSHKDGIAHGHQKRDFVYVGDVVHVLHFAVAKPIQRGIYNLGSGKARTFLDLVKATFKAMGKPENIEFIDTPVEIRDKYQYFTEAKMDKLSHESYPKPFTSLEDGVKQYVETLLINRV